MAALAIIAGVSAIPTARADSYTSSNALRIVQQYSGSWTSIPTITNGGQVSDAPLLGNGDVGALVMGNIDAQTFVLGKNEFWSLAQEQVKAMSRLSVSVSGMSGATFNATENIAVGEVNETATLSGNTITTKDWVQATDTTNNMLVQELSYSGSGSKTVTVSLAVGNNNTFPTTVGSSGSVLYLDVQGDSTATVGGYTSPKVRTATTVIGATATINGSTLTFTIQPGGSYTLLTCIMSNYDSSNFQSLAISNINTKAQSDINTMLGTHHTWWNNFYSESFVEIADKTVEKEWYGSLYLMACESRAGEQSPALWGNWIMEDMNWQGDYTLNYNAESPYLFTAPANHVDLAQSYDKIMLDWMPRGATNATNAGYTGYYYEGHIGPLPETNAGLFMSQKSDASFVAMPMIIRYYHTHDLTYANQVYPFLKGVAAWWQSYLVWSGTQYDDFNDATFENESYPQTDNTGSLGYIKYVLQACIDMSTELNVDSSLRPTWQNIINTLAPYPTFVQNSQTIFRCTSVGTAFKNNAKVLQFAYPGAQLGTGSSSTLLTEAQNTFTQLNCWTESHACLAYPIAARIDYPASTILSNLDSEINNSAYPNMAFHTGGGGIEDVNIAPGTVDEMLLQSCQGTLRLFNDWPSNTTATFGDLLADGAFLISAQVTGSGNTVQYVRLISQQGKTAVFSNPWPGQSVEVYRNGTDTGTVSGTTFSITTSSGDTILMATAGTSYATILSRMGLGNQVAAPTFSPGGGNYGSAQNISITSTTGGASIRYTTDGSTPSETVGTLYSGPVNISSTTTLKAIAYESGMTDSNITSATYTIGEGAYGGTPAPIPGTVQAENYDTGGQGVAYNVTSINGTDNGYRSDGVDLEVCSDTGGGVDVGWESPGQWFKYTVNVAAAGTYTVSFRVAAPNAVTDAFHLSNSSGTNLSGNVNVPATGGYQTWATVTASVTLPAGQQILTLNQDTGGGIWNLNYLGFASSGGGTLLPTQNAAVRDGTYANTNFNGATTIRVKNDVVNNNRHVYLTFDTTSMPTVSSAVINLYVVGTGSTASRTITVYQEPTTSWLESTITWNNAPAAGTQIGSFNVSTTVGIYYNFDVTSYVQAQRAAGNKVVSFELINNVTDVNGLVDFASREATTGQPGLTIAP